jgi:hypothetical protein
VCLVALAIGIAAAFLSSANRARGADLDRRQLWCETRVRQNDLLDATNGREEWLLLYGDDESAAAAEVASATPPVHPSIDE